jgi:hypothetical protein
VSFAAVTLCVASQRVFVVVYFVIVSVRKLLDILSYIVLSGMIDIASELRQMSTQLSLTSISRPLKSWFMCRGKQFAIRRCVKK